MPFKYVLSWRDDFTLITRAKIVIKGIISISYALVTEGWSLNNIHTKTLKKYSWFLTKKE